MKEECPVVDGWDDGVPSVLKKLRKWGDYPSVGSPLESTRFIPMKTPLSLSILANWSLDDRPRHSLTVPGYLEEQRALGRQVGLFIDLCNHACLYEEDLPRDLMYRHVRLIAKELPSRDHVKEVARIAEEFWQENPDGFVAIHCAYGFNRTGFILSSFLVERRGYSVGEALAAFAKARSPGVKHEKFKSELCSRYGSSPQPGPSVIGNGSSESDPENRKRSSRDEEVERPNYSIRSFRGNLIRIGKKVCSFGRPSTSKGRGEETGADKVSKKLMIVENDDINDGSIQCDENESLGSVDRQILGAFRWDLVREHT
ncbi:hypothetical protein BSKO_04096 [Bryopsis sp. KO-2023]|nr:hypothetical protein BSKO_04096 [Bryopsis sp. KO-2023]